MNTLINFLQGVVSIIFVMIGCFFMNLYLNQPLGFVSFFCGLLGFFILYPAIDKWKETLKFRKNSQE